MRYGALDFLRHLDRHEAGRKIEIVLTAFVDHPHIAVMGGFFIRQYLINFVAFQGGGYPVLSIQTANRGRDWLVSRIVVIHVAFPLHFLPANVVLRNSAPVSFSQSKVQNSYLYFLRERANLVCFYTA